MFNGCLRIMVEITCSCSCVHVLCGITGVVEHLQFMACLKPMNFDGVLANFFFEKSRLFISEGICASSQMRP